MALDFHPANLDSLSAVIHISHCYHLEGHPDKLSPVRQNSPTYTRSHPSLPNMECTTLKGLRISAMAHALFQELLP